MAKHSKSTLKCNTCDFETKQKSALNKHMIIHSDEKRFRCEICDFTTKTKEYHIHVKFAIMLLKQKDIWNNIISPILMKNAINVKFVILPQITKQA